MFVVVAGPAGSGKTTLGRVLARSLGLPILDLDTLTNPLLDRLGGQRSAASDRSGTIPLPWPAGIHWNDPTLRDAVRPARYAVLLAAVADHAAVGSGAVLVAPFTRELEGGAEWEALVRAAGSTPRVLWLQASSALLAKRREERAADRDAHVLDPPASDHPVVAHVVVDAASTTGDQLAAIRPLFDDLRTRPVG